MRSTITEVFPSPTGGRKWYWHAKGGNGEIIAQGEAYATKWNAKRAALRAFPDAKVRYL